MTDVEKPMKRVKDVNSATARGIEKTSSEKMMIDSMVNAKDAFVGVCEMFNKIREMLAYIKGPVFDCANVYPSAVKHIREARGIDVEQYVASISPEDAEPLSDCEDGEKFLVILERITSERDPFKVMRLARKTKSGLDADIERWESKLIKMKNTLDGIGEESVQSDAFRQKMFSFSKMVDSLKTRRETLDLIFDDSKRKILDFVERETNSYEAKKKKKVMKLTI